MKYTYKVFFLAASFVTAITAFLIATGVIRNQQLASGLYAIVLATIWLCIDKIDGE